MGLELLLDARWLASIAGVFGLVVGSFLNVVIYRLPLEQSIVAPGSHCPACATPIRALDNVPVLSYLVLAGRCRSCRAPISPRYPAIELLTGCVFAAIAWRFGPTGLAVLFMFFAAGLIAAAMIDIDHQIIPDEISLGGLALGLLLVPAVWTLAGTPYSFALSQSVLGALIGGGTLWTLGFVHARVSVLLGRRFDHWPGEGEPLPTPRSLDYWTWFPGMGFGDVKLLGMIGAFLGPLGVLVTILAASFVGLFLGLGWAALQGRFSSPFGFGPAIAVGALIALLVPPSVLGLA